MKNTLSTIYKSIINFNFKTLYSDISLFTVIFLSILSIISIVYKINLENIGNKIFLHFSLIFIITFLAPLLINFFNIKRLSLLNSFIITLIIFLLIDPTQNTIITSIMCGLALFTRLFVRYDNKPVFNSSMIGVGLVALFFSIFTIKGVEVKPIISWWGMNFQQILVDYKMMLSGLLILLAGIYISYKSKRYILASAAIFFMGIFWITDYALFTQIRDFKENMSVLIEMFFQGTLVFTIFLILIDPITTPKKNKSQIYYGLFFSLIFAYLFFSKIDNAIIYSIILINIAFYFVKILPTLRRLLRPQLRKVIEKITEKKSQIKKV
ncbi:MAG: RnfABCDGE type electron transport complex subunit D [bacterium]